MAGRSSMIPGLEVLQGSKPSTSGIVTRFDSEDRVIPESRRPDGTIRKERRVRPGFTPPEDVGRFRSARQQDMDARKLPPGVVPGMGGARPEVKAALSGMSASAKKNQKRKEKRKEEESAAAKTPKAEETPDSWDAEEEQPASQPAPPQAAVPESTNSTTVDPQKRAKALQKKIRQIEEIKQKQAKGETLLPEQEEKVNSLKSLEEELATLSL